MWQLRRRALALSAAVLLMVSANTLMAQDRKIFLDNYTVSVDTKGAKAGQVIDQSGSPVSAKIIKDKAGLFTISKQGELQLKPKVTLPKEGAFAYQVTVKAGEDTATFTIVKDQFIRNRVVAHRGAWKNQPGSQNSLSSLKDAIRLGCAGSEFDVWLSADEELVLSHDPQIGGKVLEETPLAELQEVQLDNGDRVPTLEEYIREGKTQAHTKLVLELKPSRKGKERGALLAAKAVAMVQQLQAQAWIYYISFDYNILKTVVALDPSAQVAYLNGEKQPEELKAEKIWGLDYHQSVFKKDGQLMDKARKNGITTNVWTVNNPEDMDAFLQAGVDFITTDEPEKLLEKVKNK